MDRTLLKSSKTPVIFIANGIGDHLMSIPSIRALSQIFNQEISIICTQGLCHLLHDDINFSNIYEIEHHISGTGRKFDVDSLLKRMGYHDLFISLNSWHSEDVDKLLFYLKPRYSMGFFSQFDVVMPRNYDRHAIELAFEVPLFLYSELKLQEFSNKLNIPICYQKEARKLRNKKGINGYPVIVIHLDSHISRMWSYQRMFEVIKELLYIYKHAQFIFVGRQEDELLSFSKQYKNAVFSFCDLSLGLSFALIMGADFFVGIDSCMLHAADLFRIPGVGLFGPTKPEEFGFFYALHRNVRSPSGLMSDISASTVFEDIHSLMSEQSCMGYLSDQGPSQ